MPPDGTPESAQPPQNPPSPLAPAPSASPAPPPQEELPDLSKWVQRLIYQWFGRRGLVIVAILIVVVPLVWSNWSTVRDLPGVATIRMWVSQAPLPTADPQRFAVALAHLEHDARASIMKN
jgi:hypothetical protein